MEPYPKQQHHNLGMLKMDFQHKTNLVAFILYNMFSNFWVSIVLIHLMLNLKHNGTFLKKKKAYHFWMNSFNEIFLKWSGTNVKPTYGGLLQVYSFAPFNTFARWLLSAHQLASITSEIKQTSMCVPGSLQCQNTVLALALTLLWASILFSKKNWVNSLKEFPSSPNFKKC